MKFFVSIVYFKKGNRVINVLHKTKKLGLNSCKIKTIKIHYLFGILCKNIRIYIFNIKLLPDITYTFRHRKTVRPFLAVIQYKKCVIGSFMKKKITFSCFRTKEIL